MLMLDTQYRMHVHIAEYSSQRYYDGKLLTAEVMMQSKSHEMPYHNDESGRYRPFVFHDVDYGTEAPVGHSLSNLDEANYIVNLYNDLVTRYPEHKKNIGIIYTHIHAYTVI